MKKNKKGFTLIELLAVIVILGLLMAIAIPSVTKYITQSRKKTIVTTIGNYIKALENDVNNMEYVFTGSNTIYALPIECIALESGGTDPFGEWMQANDNYWAYLLVQYNDTTSSYTYGFTFKDSAGYGLYPTVESKIKQTGKQIQTEIDLSRPKTGAINSLTTLAKWQELGFEVDETTKFQVLEAESEGTTGNGIDTCTLSQKGNNYAQVEEAKEVAKEEAIKYRTLIKTTESNTTAFWQYRDKIKTITFEDMINIPSDAYKSWDVSTTGNGKVMAYIKLNASNSSYYDLYIQGDGQIYANPDSSWLFYNFVNVDSINNMSILDTSKVTNMDSMFKYTGYSSTKFTLNLGNKFNTSNVTNMSNMFNATGYSSRVFTLDLGDKFDTSKVTDMNSMFKCTGYASTKFTLNLGDKFNTSNVTNMWWMFNATGYSSPVFTLNLGDKIDTSKVTDMRYMFENTGYKSTVFTLDLGDKFDTSKVTNMNSMFKYTGYSSPKFILDLGYNFDTSKVIDMSNMFNATGYSSRVFTLDLGDKFDTSKVTDMNSMFKCTGYSSTKFTLNLGDKFNTSNVTNTWWMFNATGYSSPIFTLNLGENFDTSKVDRMNSMFESTGYSNPVFTLDLGDKFDTSKVNDMNSMFKCTGYSSTKFTLDLGDNFNTSNVTDMRSMFDSAGYSSPDFTLDCRSWNVDKVTKYTKFNTNVSSKVTPPIWKN